MTAKMTEKNDSELHLQHHPQHQWNRTDSAFLPDKTLHQLFEQQVEKTPDSIALVYEEQVYEELTYRQLNDQANQLARVIRARYQQQYQRKIQPDSLIALYLDRSPLIVVSILAVLKAGAAYVPLSPQYPSSRCQFIINQTGAELVLTQQQHQQAVNAFELAQPPLLIVADSNEQRQSLNTANLPAISTATDLAYVFYTSGTTGQPKGVMIEHRAVVNTLCSLTDIYQITEQYRKISCFSNTVFDISVSEIFGCLCFGGELHLLNTDICANTQLLSEYIHRAGLNFLFVPPAILALLPKEPYPSLQAIIFAGERCDQNNCVYWAKTAVLYNCYGPTEAAIYASAKRATERNLNEIGRPLNNVRLYVLDTNGELAPIGTPGELFIGGASLARGYFNRPDLTTERFIDNPFASETDQAKGYTRLYKTGDIVRWLPDGYLEYQGRNDFQVKIRGYRIELPEIEGALNALPGIKQALVIDRQHGNHKTLAAYIVTVPGGRINSDELKTDLLRTLPDYMIPASFTQLAVIPLTINGKIDRQALPEPKLVSSDTYVAPRNPLEQQLCDIWQQVLSLPQIGIEDNFYAMGGDSISAIRLAAACRRQLSLDIPLVVLLEQQTIARVVACLDNIESVRIPSADVRQYPLSFAQERLLFIEQIEGGTDAYHISHCVQLTADADLQLLTQAVNLVVKRHPILNTVYGVDQQGNINQQRLDKDINLHHQSLTGQNQLMRAIEADMTQPFDLTAEPAFRLHCYQLNDTRYGLFMWHHIAFDGWSTDVFLQQLAQVYQALCQGLVANLPEPDISYGDYALWQRQTLQGESLEHLLDYWRQQLSGYESLMLPTDFPRPANFDYQGADLPFSLDLALSAQLRALAKARQTTLHSLMLSGFYITLATLSGQSDMVVGAPTDNRHHAQTQDLVGFFVNTLVLRAQVLPQMSIDALIQQVHQMVIEARVHQELPFVQLIDALNTQRDLSRHGIFQVLFSLQDFAEAAHQVSGLPFDRLPEGMAVGNNRPAKFDLSVFISPAKERISGYINYATSLFAPDSITRMITIYQRVLEALVADTQQPIGSIACLSQAQNETLQYDWSGYNAVTPTAPAATLHQAFEAQVAKTPDHTALIFENFRLSYQQLDQQANQLAHFIRSQYHQCYQQPMAAGTPIALYLDRSVTMVISILAMLKAGGAYVPLSPEHPKARSEFILNDIQAPFVLTDSVYAPKLRDWLAQLEPLNTKVLIAAQLPQDLPPQNINSPLTLQSCATDLAYVIYTSGTTGQPKGVGVSHGASVLRNLDMAQQGQTAQNCYLLTTNYIFDVCVSDLFSHLLVGATVVLTRSVFDVAEIQHLLATQPINACHFVPSQFSAFMAGQREPLSLARLYFSGEDLTSAQLAQIDFNQTQVINYYGPTETGEATSYIVPDVHRAHIIGRPLAGVQVYVVQNGQTLAPIGTPGELYIGGIGLAEGYFNRPDLTQAAFITNPFMTNPSIRATAAHARLYKSGDLVRWLPDGQLEYLGRTDFQVKIHGHRIELAEVEQALNQLSEVKQAVVIDKVQATAANSQYLAAYIVTHKDLPLVADKLKMDLATLLPAYMVPASFTQVAAIPLTINGKLDRRALPDPVFVSDVAYVKPRNKLEQQLCDIWQATLEVEQVGIYDRFFDIGGNSIIAIRLTAVMRRTLAMDIPLVLLFEQQTVAGIASGLMAKL